MGFSIASARVLRGGTQQRQQLPRPGVSVLSGVGIGTAAMASKVLVPTAPFAKLQVSTVLQKILNQSKVFNLKEKPYEFHFWK